MDPHKIHQLLRGMRTQILIALGIISGFVLLALICGTKEPSVVPQSARTLPPPITVAPIELQAFQKKAWQLVDRRLSEADTASEFEIDRCVDRVERFLSDRQAKGVQPFCKDLLSLKGKWKLLYSNLPFADKDAHFAFLKEQFDEKLFKMSELKDEVEGAVRQYVVTLQGIENQLLVNCRTDINDSHPLASKILPQINSEESFQELFSKTLMESHPKYSKEVWVGVGQMITTAVISQIVANTVIRVGFAAGTETGIEAGILSVGATSSWETAGVGLVVCIVVDIGLDWFLKVIGEDAPTRLAEKVNGTLDRFKHALLEGDPEVVRIYHHLGELAIDDPDESVREKCANAANKIDQGGRLGLRHDLERLHTIRSNLRKDALSQILSSGVPQ